MSAIQPRGAPEREASVNSDKKRRRCARLRRRRRYVSQPACKVGMRHPASALCGASTAGSSRKRRSATATSPKRSGRCRHRLGGRDEDLVGPLRWAEACDNGWSGERATYSCIPSCRPGKDLAALHSRAGALCPFYAVRRRRRPEATMAMASPRPGSNWNWPRSSSAGLTTRARRNQAHLPAARPCHARPTCGPRKDRANPPPPSGFTGGGD